MPIRDYRIPLEPCFSAGCTWKMTEDIMSYDFYFQHIQGDITHTKLIRDKLRVGDPHFDIWGVVVQPWIEDIHSPGEGDFGYEYGA